MNGETDRLSRKTNLYHDGQLDIDRKLIFYRYRTIRPYFVGSSCLELGPAEGLMTALLLSDFSEVTIVEGAKRLLNAIPERPGLIKVHSLFETYELERTFPTIIMDYSWNMFRTPQAC